MTIDEYVKSLGIDKQYEVGEENSYVITLNNSDEFGKTFTKLEKSKDLDPLEDNQVVTEQGSSLIYESKSQPYILNLIADWEGDVYQLVINEIGE